MQVVVRHHLPLPRKLSGITYECGPTARNHTCVLARLIARLARLIARRHMSVFTQVVVRHHVCVGTRVVVRDQMSVGVGHDTLKCCRSLGPGRHAPRESHAVS